MRSGEGCLKGLEEAALCVDDGPTVVVVVVVVVDVPQSDRPLNGNEHHRFVVHHGALLLSSMTVEQTDRLTAAALVSVVV